MSVLVVGSVALDTVETPFARAERVIGGSAVFFGASASRFTGVRVVAVVGDDYPLGRLDFLQEAGVDLRGLEQAPGESFFWAGRYRDEFAVRDTLETRLGVFGAFDPVVPSAYRDSEVVFLGNINPTLQLRVLDQVAAPRLVAADTMNFWIGGARNALMRLLARLDVLFVNDEEALQLSGSPNVAQAAEWIRAHGPTLVVVKLGERGAVLFADGWTCERSGRPAAQVVDPTGAGDAFAGGFMGHLDRVRADAADKRALEDAMAYGAVMGSLAVEAFSADRLRDVRADEVEAAFRGLPHLRKACAGAGA